MTRHDLGKKRMGSVAVDARTGVEHYGVPKATPNHPRVHGVQPSAASPAPGGVTPNYREKKDGSAQNIAGVPAEFMNLFEHDPSEVILMQATRHPIGVFAIFATAGLAVIVVIAMYVLLLADSTIFSSLGMGSSSVAVFGGLVLVILLGFVVGLSLLAVNVYRKSRLVLTNQKVVLIQYHSLISREVSQLNIAEVEDVNVSQITLMDRIFKTGRITIETAGEQNNYVLSQVEQPYEFARKTIQMHEGSIAEYGN